MTTGLCQATSDKVVLRGHDLTKDIMGTMSFAEAFFLLVTGRRLDAGGARVLDAVLVALMEHGMTPQAIATRMVYLAAPDSLQGAIAAGLLGVGGQFAGTMQETASLLVRIVSAPVGEEAAREIVREYRHVKKGIPGFGHHLHKPDDPRSLRLLAIAREGAVAGAHVAAIELLSRELDAAAGRHLTINATGAIAAVLMDIGFPASLMRGVAVVSRSAGLVAQIGEEEANPIANRLWRRVEEELVYGPT
ncbi:MAG: citryl-CoA lyase [Bosea sp.]|uniref:citryl-CoA lyase n=1 Tax=Bosea sp. (in: a-proteobacteria) TaxID=1871050 RepID=UPI0014853EEC|nr:citryl-CoA lyase [Bosea sp. (in: a-proteobacteria)]MCP4735063.1 citryl-CoA lyase [Bosea sp. (in: a-proteobacteria)]